MGMLSAAAAETVHLAPSSDEVSTLAEKNAAVLKRKQVDALLKSSVDRMVSKHVSGIDGINGIDGADEDGVGRTGCFSGISRCFPWTRSSRTRLPTTEMAAAGAMGAAGAAGAMGAMGAMGAAAAKSTATASAASRLFGTRKSAASESKKLLDAIAMADAKVLELSERIELGRKRAVALRKEGKRAEALMALKKAKNDEKLLASASAALETLEGQKDMLENAALQRELASALASTTKQIKGKTKGLVKFAEKAVDDTQDLRDDAEDLSAAFEGIQPASQMDEDLLMEELNSMMQDEVQDREPQQASTQQASTQQASTQQASTQAAAVFPSAPTTATFAADDDLDESRVLGKKAERKAAKRPLLSGAVASDAAC